MGNIIGNPVFEVELDKNKVNNRRHYILRLNDANLEHFLQGCPEFDRLIGIHKDVSFNILPTVHDMIPKEIMPAGAHGEYFISIGAAVPELPFKHTNEEFQKAAQQRYENLENALKQVKNVPIVYRHNSTKLVTGYVSIELKKD